MNHYQLHYAGFSCTGLVRRSNQDNFWCLGRSLPVVHGDEEVFSGIFIPEGKQWIAVFDGLGGEQQGEAASGLAAKEFGRQTPALSGRVFPKDAGEAMQELCLAMNEEVCSYAAENKIQRMGTTAVGLCFDREAVFGFNVGDSRCFLYRDSAMTQLSTDHVVRSVLFRRRSLTQCIGMTDEVLPQPSVFERPYREADIYVLCSDGLTDMLSDEEIARVLSGTGSLEERLEMIREKVFEKGAADNTTVFLIGVDRSVLSGQEENP